MRSAAQAYGMTANRVSSPRELEADLLLKAASRMQAVQDGWDKTRPQLDEVLLFNRKLWTIFITSITAPEHPMPAETRQNVANLAACRT
jgi:flagellar biosynthesis activator protein FlaF